MKHHVAYLYTTRHIGLTYHVMLPSTTHYHTIQGAYVWGDRIFADGTGVQGNMLVGGSGLCNISAPVLSTSTKDNGVVTFTPPDGELKIYINVVNSVMDVRLIRRLLLCIYVFSTLLYFHAIRFIFFSLDPLNSLFQFLCFQFF